MINILMIDDNVDVCESLRLKLLDDDQYDFDYRTNLHEGMEALITAQGSIDALVLGGSGLLTPNDKEKRDVHVIRGVKLARQRFPHLPVFIFTAWPQKNKELLMVFDEQFPVIDKNNGGFTVLLDLIVRTVQQELTYIVKRKYRRVLDVFETGRLRKNAEELYPALIEILTFLHKDELNELNPTRRNGIFTTLRKIQEAIHQQISWDYPHVLPPEIESFNGQINHLAGNLKVNAKGKHVYTTHQYMSSATRSLSKSLRCNSSSNVHYDDDCLNSVYTLKAAIYALLEVIMWYRVSVHSGAFERRRA